MISASVILLGTKQIVSYSSEGSSLPFAGAHHGYDFQSCNHSKKQLRNHSSHHSSLPTIFPINIKTSEYHNSTSATIQPVPEEPEKTFWERVSEPQLRLVNYDLTLCTEEGAM